MKSLVLSVATSGPRIAGGRVSSSTSTGRTILLLGAFLIGSLAVLIPWTAWADPHAVFYTDRAQAQLFFNTIAALNQADYVEPPGRPPILSDQRIGQFIRTGNYVAPTPVPIDDFNVQTTRDPVTNEITSIQGAPPLEPNEATDTNLPRIRVRQVTSDDGDALYRQRLRERAQREEMMATLGLVACRIATQVFGERATNATEYCPDDVLTQIVNDAR